MKIILASASIHNETAENLETLERFVPLKQDGDFIIFGQSFLYGFDCLSWDVQLDKDIVVRGAQDE